MTPIIIIFGAAVRPNGGPSGAMRDRVDSALRCARRLPDARFMPTGGVGRFGPAEADVMAGLLQEQGIAPTRIIPEPTGVNTIRSVLACVRLLRGEAGPPSTPIYVATSAYHMPRCLLLLRLAGLHARPCRPPRGPASSSHAKRWYWRLRELPALPIDGGLMLLLRLGGRL